MRTKDGICLLCKTRKSSNTNSHIVPKFLSKSVFGEVQKKQGFLLDTSKANKRPEISQDSPKENYILCPECEKYFEILETYISGRVHNRLWDIRKKDQFTDSENGAGIRRKICEEVDPWIFRLFIYSIVWRCSISESKAYNSFKLEKEEEEHLRENLAHFISSTQNDLLEKIETDSKIIKIIPFILFTSESFKNRTGNVLSANPYSKNPYHIELNEYTLLITFSEVDTFKTFDFLLNNGNSKIKIAFLKEDLWEKLKNDFLKSFQKIAMEQTKAKGLKPYIDPKIV